MNQFIRAIKGKQLQGPHLESVGRVTKFSGDDVSKRLSKAIWSSFEHDPEENLNRVLGLRGLYANSNWKLV